MKKKIVFVTGTRADFGKLKSLINMLNRYEAFETHLLSPVCTLTNGTDTPSMR